MPIDENDDLDTPRSAPTLNLIIILGTLLVLFAVGLVLFKPYLKKNRGGVAGLALTDDLLKHSWKPFKMFPPIVQKHLYIFTVWNNSTLLEGKPWDQIKEEFKQNIEYPLPDDLYRWDFYYERHNGNAVIAGGLVVGVDNLLYLILLNNSKIIKLADLKFEGDGASQIIQHNMQGRALIKIWLWYGKTKERIVWLTYNDIGLKKPNKYETNLDRLEFFVDGKKWHLQNLKWKKPKESKTNPYLFLTGAAINPDKPTEKYKLEFNQYTSPKTICYLDKQGIAICEDKPGSPYIAMGRSTLGDRPLSELTLTPH